MKRLIFVLAVIALLVPMATAFADDPVPPPDCPGACPDTSFIGACKNWLDMVVTTVTDAVGRIHVTATGTVGELYNTSSQEVLNGYRIRLAVDGVAGYQCSSCNNKDNVTLPTGIQFYDQTFVKPASGPYAFSITEVIPASINPFVPHVVSGYVGQIVCANCPRTDQTKSDAYVVCTTKVPVGEWSEWVWDEMAQDEVRTRPLGDVVNPKRSCGIEEEFRGYKECSRVNEVVLNGHIEYRDVNTNKLCESKCRDRWVEQSYGLFELEGPAGEYATMYVYADENGKLPIGISVDRQRCVLGWVAVNTPYAGWVYKNPCTGEYKWNDQTFTPRRDVIKHGVCDRSQPCLVQ